MQAALSFYKNLLIALKKDKMVLLGSFGRLLTAIKKDKWLVLGSLIVGIVLAQSPLFIFLHLGAIGDTPMDQVINWTYDLLWYLMIGSWVFYIPFRFKENEIKSFCFLLVGFIKVKKEIFFSFPTRTLVPMLRPPRYAS